MTEPRLWTPEEDNLLIQGLTERYSYARIAEDIPGRNHRMCRFRAERLGLRMRHKRFGDFECPKEGSRDLLQELEAAFHKYAKLWGVDYLDARTLLMNCEAL